MTSRSGPSSGPPPGEIGTAWSVPPGGPRRTTRPGTRDVLGGVLLICGGLLAVLQGVAALAGDGVHARVGSYVYGLTLTGWGLLHLVLGVLTAATGAALLRGAARARPAGLLLASLGLLAQFLFLPYAPPRSAVVAALDVCAIRALTREPRRPA
ncbi:hypothetical protein [Streptomyces sp. A012304]|uniref:DUF7144 family membrane protein n=1 Tax=Streptomyces sp. A012304 TaxID=375446 RepID=UPI00222F8FE6|nr:hypothetical protein [Streptomyces sp. A012304]GKQ35913.1 hypothetical protein ALMP_24560 [Streptomyces sp. A012304]